MQTLLVLNTIVRGASGVWAFQTRSGVEGLRAFAFDLPGSGQAGAFPLPGRAAVRKVRAAAGEKA